MKTAIATTCLLLAIANAAAPAPPEINRAKLPDEVRAAQVRDMKWGMFICWSFSTFSGREWTPTRDKDAAYFKATGCDTDQWARTAKDAGMKYILFLTKHHDGFCLWDTKTTDKKVTNSPLGVDVLAALRKSCDKHGIKLALYFSEGDWNWPGAVDGKGGSTGGGSNPEMKKAQLKELLTNYGPIEFWWMDHATGTGGLSHKETVEWMHQFQPNTFVGFNHGEPAGRLCLREMGKPGKLGDRNASEYNKEAEASYKGYLVGEFTYPILPPHKGGAMWFYSLPEHDNLCLPADKLFKDYQGAVKYGNIFSINVGPNYTGKLREIDVKTLWQVGEMIRADLPAQRQRVLWSDTPVSVGAEDAGAPRRAAGLWERSVYPLGNGRLGCTVFGEPRKDRIQFNEDSLWVGNEDCTGGYQPFGDVYVEMPHEAYSDYRRELDIGRAVQTITYKSGGVGYKREYFASHPAQVLVFRFSADRKAALSGKVSLGNEQEIPVVAANETLVMKGDTSKFWWWQVHLKEPQRLLASREYASDKNIDLHFEAQLRVLREGGTVKTVDNAVVFENCDSVTLLLAADTNYLNRRDKGWRGEHPHARVTGQIVAAAKRSYADLLAEHVADYRSLYGRLSIDLGDTPAAVKELPTAERVKAYGEQFKKNGATVDRDLEALLYQYARYLMISCSRPGEGALPANLQGLWLISKRPAWRCDYHTDVNVQMNYWFVDQANLSECFVPLAEWIDSIREVRKEETRKVLKVNRGWLMRSENGVFGGSTWHFQKGDSAWLCQNLWDHYAFTRDKEYLKRYAYPVMKEISEFWVDHLKALPDGTLVAPDGRSPEHGPTKADGVSYDQQLCWDLFTNVIEASEALGVDADYCKELLAKREKLLRPKIGKWGQLQEWMEDIDDPKNTHRHINHMIAVYPGRQIHPTTTPKLAEAAKVGLIARGVSGPGWSTVWKCAVFARLWDAERAYAMLANLIAGKIHGNLWAVHPPFQIDANFGYAAGVNEMLLQSHMGYIHLLPALPKAWPTGSVRGMRVRGGYEVDMEWKDGALTQAVVRGISNGPAQCVVRYGKGTSTFTLAKGESRVLRAGDFEQSP
jgi:alpha-L-fucosidase 2